MSQNNIKQIHIQSRTDTSANWVSENPILLDREIGYEREEGKYKIGDGITHWNDLPYATPGSEVGEETPEGGEIFNDYENNKAPKLFSHAEGSQTTASGEASHAEGKSTIASGDSQHVQGKYNLNDSNNTYAHIVGNGISESQRSNAHTLDWDGNAWFQGEVKIGSEALPLATKKLVDDKFYILEEETLPQLEENINNRFQILEEETLPQLEENIDNRFQILEEETLPQLEENIVDNLNTYLQELFGGAW